MEPKTINNYYPVFLDIREFNSKTNSDIEIKSNKGISIDHHGELKNSNADADSLMRMAKNNNLSDLQTLVLLLKNAFEGQAYLTYDLDNDYLLNHGTSIIDWNNQKMIELTESFNENIGIYQEGLYKGWEEIYTDKMDSRLFKELITVILNSQIFRLPVSQLKELTISFLIKNFAGKYFHSSIIPILSKITTDILLIEIIDEQYSKAFSDLIQQIESKTNCLGILQVKIGLANDPNVNNHDDLQNIYHEYLIQEKSGFHSIPHSVIGNERSNNNRLKNLEQKTAKLFRAISKLCREVFITGVDDEKNSYLNDFFMIASKYWNSNNNSTSDQVVNYFMLLQLYFRVIIYRTFSGLPVSVEDFFFLNENWLDGTQFKELELKLKEYLGKIEILKWYHKTYSKIKNLEDKEISSFHKEFLIKKIEYLEKKILKLEKKLERILNDK